MDGSVAIVALCVISTLGIMAAVVAIVFGKRNAELVQAIEAHRDETAAAPRRPADNRLYEAAAVQGAAHDDDRPSTRAHY
jgi:hypothetical protein